MKKIIFGVLMILAIFISMSAVMADNETISDSNSTQVSVVDDNSSVENIPSNSVANSSVENNLSVFTINIDSNWVIGENNSPIQTNNSTQFKIYIMNSSVNATFDLRVKKQSVDYVWDIVLKEYNSLYGNPSKIQLIRYNELLFKDRNLLTAYLSPCFSINELTCNPCISNSCFSINELTCNPCISNSCFSTNKLVFKSLILESKDITTYYKSNVFYKIKVFPNVAGKEVIFKVDKKTYKVKTDNEGYATLKVNLKPGKYTVTAIFDNNTVKNKIVIKSTLITSNVVKKFKKPAKFNVKVLNSKGKVYKNQKVTIKFKGKTYKVKTNSKGIASFNIPKNLKKGTYAIKTTYNGYTVSNKVVVK